MSDFGGSGLDPNLRASVANDLSVPGDARVEGLNNQLSGLFSQRLSKTEAMAMKFETLADIGAEIQQLLADIAAKQDEIAQEQGKDDPNPSRIASLQGQIDTLKGRIQALKDRQDDIHRDIGRLRSDIQQLDGQINAKRVEIGGAERERDSQRDSKRAGNDAQIAQVREAEERVARAATSNAEIGKKVEVKIHIKDKVLTTDRHKVEVGKTDVTTKDDSRTRLTEDQMRVAWRDLSFKSLTTGQAIQLVSWSLGTMPELRQPGENKFVASGPRDDGLLAP